MIERAQPSSGVLAAGLVAAAVCCGLPLMLAIAATVGVTTGLWLLAAVVGTAGAGLGWWRHRQKCATEVRRGERG